MNPEGLQNIMITPDVVAQSISQLRKGKDDGNQGLNFDHLIENARVSTACVIVYFV